MNEAAAAATVAPTITPPAPVCMNCGAALSGAFCSACGQETRIETPTVGEFVREFVQDQMALEGKLLRTLKVLVMKPGALTLDYIAGRRQCYIRPLRLYLALSVAFFAVSGLVSHPNWLQGNPGDEDKPLISLASERPEGSAPAAAQSAGDKAAAAVPKSNASDTPKPPAGGNAAAAPKSPAAGAPKPVDQADDPMRDLTTGNALLDVRVHKYFSQTRKQAGQQISQAIENDAPIAMFFLLPLFAGLLQLAYLRHHLRFGAHLLFALHYHAFVFLDLLLQEIPWPSPLSAVFKFAIPVYLVLALRRVYGGRLWLTGIGVAVLLLVYSVLIGITIGAAAIISILSSV